MKCKFACSEKKNANSFCICADAVSIEMFLDKEQITQELYIIHMPNFIQKYFLLYLMR